MQLQRGLHRGLQRGLYIYIQTGGFIKFRWIDHMQFMIWDRTRWMGAKNINIPGFSVPENGQKASLMI